MKEYKLGENTVVTVKVPEGVCKVDVWNNQVCFDEVLQYPLSPGNWTILGKASSITEEQAKRLVETFAAGYYNYEYNVMSPYLKTPLDSFNSWLTANGIDKDSVILKKE